MLKDKRYYFLICQHQMIGFCISLIMTWKMSFLMQWKYSWCNTMGKILRSFIIYHLFTLSSLLPFCSQWLDLRSCTGSIVKEMDLSNCICSKVLIYLQFILYLALPKWDIKDISKRDTENNHTHWQTSSKKGISVAW